MKYIKCTSNHRCNNPNLQLSLKYSKLIFVIYIHFQYNSDTKFITKMGRTLLPKFPRDQDERLWRFIRVLILGSDDPDIEDPLMIRPPLAANSNGEIVCNDEDEIDDDEENALNVTGPFAGNRSAPPKSSTPTSSSGVAPPASTEEVISLLLQQQAPLAPPAAHQSAVVTTANSASAPLDFSTSDHSRYRDNYK